MRLCSPFSGLVYIALWRSVGDVSVQSFVRDGLHSSMGCVLVQSFCLYGSHTIVEDVGDAAVPFSGLVCIALWRICLCNVK